MKNDLSNFLYSHILRDIDKVLNILEYQPTFSDGFPTFDSFKRIRLIEGTLHNLLEELRVSDTLLDSFKVTKALDDTYSSFLNFKHMFGKEE